MPSDADPVQAEAPMLDELAWVARSGIPAQQFSDDPDYRRRSPLVTAALAQFMALEFRPEFPERFGSPEDA